MATTPPLPISNIVSLSVSVAPAAASANPFNQGLFIGNSAVIPSYGANSRLRKYAAATWNTAMLTDGFTINEPEYIAAGIYFSQNEPASYIWIGRQDLTAIATATLGAGGMGWAVGDTFTIAQAGANYGIGKVLTLAGSAVATFSIIQQGTGYAVASGLVCTAVAPSGGSGLTINVTGLGESLLQAAQACRAANSVWYGLAVYNPADADNLALAEWADPLWQSTRYYIWSNDAGILNNATNNLAVQLKNLSLRVLGVYSTTQGGLYPNNIYAAVALMGLEMGLNTGLAGSFFSPAAKQLVGIAPEPLTETQYTAITGNFFNVYGNFGGQFLWFETGLLSNGQPSYLWLYLAVLVAQIQINEMNVIGSLPAVPQTNAGQQLLITACNQACALLASIGFIAGAVWRGQAVLGLATGQSLESGYLNQSQPYAQQSSANRAAGQSMPIYCCITTAGAVISVQIAVYTQQ